LNHLNTFKRRPHLDTCHDQVGSGEVVFKSVCGKRVVVPLRRFQVRSVRLGSLWQHGMGPWYPMPLLNPI